MNLIDKVIDGVLGRGESDRGANPTILSTYI